MSKHNDRKRRSRPESSGEDRPKRIKGDKFEKIQQQVDNLTKIVQSLVEVQKEKNSPAKIKGKDIQDETLVIDELEDKENNSNNIITIDDEETTINENALKVLELDSDEFTYKKAKYHPELMKTWLKWKNERIPEKNKKLILESYDQKRPVVC
ncbi:uncharacterized protein [Fopius arisanus]|uniref:Uncharacterized protein n=1 Tax=Fopius arisanus TaxID=64838 RepID=A0A9R1SYX7_9HYME|nr:PREDICTED: uncharacterized protein LOC105264492 [Fopius arisanus]